MTFRRSLAALALILAAAQPLAAETYRHTRGELALEAVPRTVLVFDTAVLDNLTALGVAPAGIASGMLPDWMADRVPADIPRVGTLFEPDLEAVAAARPDLVLIANRSSAKYPDLAPLAPTLDMTMPRGQFLQTARENLLTLGRIFARQDEAAALLARLDAEVAALRSVAPEAGRVLVVLTSGGRMSAHGAGSRFGLLHDDFGLQPAAEGLDTGNHGQAISHEFILETNPDWLFVVDRDAAVGNEGAAAAQLLDNDLVRRTTAGQKGQILYLDPAAMYVAPSGITAMTRAAAQIRAAITAR